MLNARLAGDKVYGLLLFIWLSLVLSLMAFFVCVCCTFPQDVLDEIWD